MFFTFAAFRLCLISNAGSGYHIVNKRRLRCVAEYHLDSLWASEACSSLPSLVLIFAFIKEDFLVRSERAIDDGCFDTWQGVCDL